MVEPGGHNAERSQHWDKYCSIHFYEEPKTAKLIKAKNRMVITGGWGRENGELLFNGCKVVVMQNKKVLEICSAILFLQIITQDRPLKNVSKG